MCHGLFGGIAHIVVVLFRLVEETLVNDLKLVCHDARIVVCAGVTLARKLIIDELLVS